MKTLRSMSNRRTLRVAATRSCRGTSRFPGEIVHDNTVHLLIEAGAILVATDEKRLGILGEPVQRKLHIGVEREAFRLLGLIRQRRVQIITLSPAE